MMRTISAVNILADSLHLLGGRISALELAVVALHKRLRQYEVGESEITIPVRAH